MKQLTPKNLIFLIGFVLFVWIGSKINFSALTGSPNQFFTLVQFFGPIAGGVLGPVFGFLTVLVANAIGLITRNTSIGLVDVLRLLPLAGAAVYFGMKEKKTSALVALIAMAVFVLHPVGRQVWFFSLFWTIPMISAFFPKILLLRSLGATMTAHAIGGAIWVWTIPMTADMWIALIPVVIFERALFTLGIAGSYIGTTTLLDKFEQWTGIDLVELERKYALFKVKG